MVTSTALWAGWVQKPMGLEVFARSQADQGKYAGKVLAGKYLLTQTLGEGGEGVHHVGQPRRLGARAHARGTGGGATAGRRPAQRRHHRHTGPGPRVRQPPALRSRDRPGPVLDTLRIAGFGGGTLFVVDPTAGPPTALVAPG